MAQQSDTDRALESWDPWGRRNNGDGGPTANTRAGDGALVVPGSGEPKDVDQLVDVFAAPLVPTRAAGGVVDLNRITAGVEPPRRQGRSPSAPEQTSATRSEPGRREASSEAARAEPVSGQLPATDHGEEAAAEEPAGGRRRGRASGGVRGERRGRAGSFDRPRRAEGEPVPELEDPEGSARQICLTALTGAAKTRQQLAEVLTKRDIPDDAAAAVLDRFVEVGLIDDAAYAAAWVSSRQAGRGLSKRALAQELRHKGIDPEVAAAALEAVDPQDEWDTARALVAKKVPSMRRLDSSTATRRLIGMLARKGYGGGLAAIVVREALDADGAAEDAAADADDGAPGLHGTGQRNDATPARIGLWSGRPLDEETEVGEGLTLDGVARTRRPGAPGNRSKWRR